LWKARSAKIVSTNYSCWINVNKFGQGLGSFDRMICDEGHHALDEVSRALQIRFGLTEIHDMLSKEFPGVQGRTTVGVWKEWAKRLYPLSAEHLKDAKERIANCRDPKRQWLKAFYHYRNLTRKLITLMLCKPEQWVVEEREDGYVLDCAVPGQYAESLLFLGVPKVMVVSATIRQKTMSMLGVPTGRIRMERVPDAVRSRYVPHHVRADREG
jgi:hypothetical protein